MKSDLLPRALTLAQDLALAAGERLRQEFFRPGGPRGYGYKADIDEEVEVDLRRALLEAFPDWSYRGEETGVEERGGPARWLVDPNDGTSTYLKGIRGNSVSIGLLWEGQPVLGVVYSPLYPDNQGDLFVWAEGCGPLRRNGMPLPRPAWPRELATSLVVLVSDRGDRATSTNLRLVKPARFRTMPSVAYRMALVAAGEAVAGVSLSSPQAHDVGACHALLRAQGGEFLDQQGRPLAYDRDGETRTGYCFGGAEEICRSLAQRPWQDVFHGGPPDDAGFLFPVKEERGRGIADARLLSRGLGCWMGQLAGDSLGSLVEFKPPQAIAAAYPEGGPRLLADGGTWDTLAGQPTDDSELALCLARTLVAQGGFDRSSTWSAYRCWAASHPFDIGLTTSKALLCYDAPPDPRRESDSQANGALMRCSPLALASWSKLERLLQWSDQDASITHPHPVCLAANRAFLRAVAAGLNGADPEQMYLQGLLEPDPGVRGVLEKARTEPPQDFCRHMGWVLIALQNAFYRLLHAPSLEEGIIATVAAGGDTDTNGCIAGALLGAAHGLRAIPEQWRLAILACRPHPDFAGAVQKRPAFCWPVDAYPLTERLLALGT